MRREKIILVIATLVSGITSYSFAQEPVKNILSIFSITSRRSFILLLYFLIVKPKPKSIKKCPAALNT